MERLGISGLVFIFCSQIKPIEVERFLIPSYDLSLRDTAELSGVLTKIGENSLFDIYDYKGDRLLHRARLFIPEDTNRPGIYKGKFFIRESKFSGYMYLASPIELERIDVPLDSLRERAKGIEVGERIKNIRLLGFVPCDSLIVIKGEGEEIRRKGILFLRNGYYLIFKRDKRLLKVIKTQERWREEL